MGECEFSRVPRIGHGEEGYDDLDGQSERGLKGNAHTLLCQLSTMVL